MMDLIIQMKIEIDCLKQQRDDLRSKNVVLYVDLEASISKQLE